MKDVWTAGTLRPGNTGLLHCGIHGGEMLCAPTGGDRSRRATFDVAHSRAITAFIAAERRSASARASQQAL
jgi:hypothetical protein